MSDVQLFTNPTFGSVRVVMQNDEPWFVGRDVAEALGYSRPSDAVYRLIDEDDKSFAMLDNLTHLGNPDVLENQQYSGVSQSKTTLINESGVYSLILSSQLPTAKQFKHWVTADVLPCIRRHEVYATPAAVERLFQDPDNLIKLFQTLKAERAAKESALAQIAADRPKVIFADAVDCSTNSIFIGELAKLIKQNGIDIGQNRLFQWMRDKGYLTKKNRPTQHSMELKLFETKESTVQQPNGEIFTFLTTKVTGKGQQYFVNKFLE